MHDIEIWSKQTSVKVLSDKKYDKDFKKPAQLVFEAAKNEYVSAQIIITANKKVSSYSLEVDHLRSSNKAYYVFKNQFTIYNQKYIQVTKSSPNAEKFGNPTGWYPDALLPFEKAVEYGENKIEAGYNQAIFVSLKIPADQYVSSYEGNFKLTVDGEVYLIPVSVTIWDFEVSHEVHCKSDFVVGSNSLMLSENDYFAPMYRAYVERLIDFRISPHRVMQFLNLPYHEGADFVREVRYFTQPGKPDLSTIMLPVYPDSVTGIDEKDFRKHAIALADACLTDKVNYYAKAAVYCGFIDEPHLNGTFDETNRVCKRFEELKNEVADEFAAKAPQTEFAAQVVQAIRDVPNYVTTKLNERFTEIQNWCPSADAMATKEDRDKYREAAKDGRNWWYTCGNPAEVPSFGIDHNLLDCRLMLWMTYDFGLKGVLYWETVLAYQMLFSQETHFNHRKLIDCYQVAARCSDSNGDGFLFYPGRPYGIYGPVESLRLHSIRDGFEEYEYLYLLDELCQKTGRDFHEEMDPLFERLYEGVTVKNDPDDFDQVRREVAEKIMLLQKECEDKQ